MGRPMTRGLYSLVLVNTVITISFCVLTVIAPFGSAAAYLWLALQFLGPAALVLLTFEIVLSKGAVIRQTWRRASFPLLVLGGLGASLAAAAWVLPANTNLMEGNAFDFLALLRALTVLAVSSTFAIWLLRRPPRRGP